MTDVLIPIEELRRLQDEVERLKSIVVEDNDRATRDAGVIEKLRQEIEKLKDSQSWINSR